MILGSSEVCLAYSQIPQITKYIQQDDGDYIFGAEMYYFPRKPQKALLESTELFESRNMGNSVMAQFMIIL